jgi:putative component of membrane protein insertase Oxa1/YidC/SpoIIIJ protein YidD
LRASGAHFGQNLFLETFAHAEKIIELNPFSHHGYELKDAALQGARRYYKSIEAFKIMLIKLYDPLCRHSCSSFHGIVMILGA